MHWLDIVIVVIALVFATVGFAQGVIKTVFGLAGVAGGIALAGQYHDRLASILSAGGAGWAGVAAFAIIVIITIVVASLVGRLVARIAKLVLLGWLDKTLGFVVGLGIGCVLCTAALTVASIYLPGAADFILQSAVAEFLLGKLPLLFSLLPEQWGFLQDSLSL